MLQSVGKVLLLKLSELAFEFRAESELPVEAGLTEWEQTEAPGRKFTSKQMGHACEMLVAAELTLAGIPPTGISLTARCAHYHQCQAAGLVGRRRAVHTRRRFARLGTAESTPAEANVAIGLRYACDTHMGDQQQRAFSLHHHSDCTKNGA